MSSESDRSLTTILVDLSDRIPSSPSDLLGLRSDSTWTKFSEMGGVPAKLQSESVRAESDRSPRNPIGLSSECVGQGKDLT